MKNQPKRLTVPRYTKPEISPEDWGSPDIVHCECKTWKAADFKYQRFSVKTIRAIKRLNNVRKRSAYDCYMQWAVRHLIRGFSCGPHPIPGTNQHFSGTYNPTSDQLDCFEDKDILNPDMCCNNFGLHYARAWFVELPRDPPDAEYAQGHVCLITEAIAYHRPEHNTYFYRRGTWSALDETPEEPPEPWEQVWDYTADHWNIEACPAHCMLWYAPPLRNSAGGMIFPPEPDYNLLIECVFHTTEVWYTHWPNKPNSHKGDRLHPDVLPDVCLEAVTEPGAFFY